MKNLLLAFSLSIIVEMHMGLHSAKAEDSTHPNVVSVLGSLHGYMLKNKNYSLKHFIVAIQNFKPDMILTEVRPEFPGPAEGSIDGGIEQSIIYAVSNSYNSKVVPVDWFDDNLIDEMARENEMLSPEMIAQLEPLQKDYENDFANGSLQELNSANVQEKTRKIYALYEKFGLLSSRKRNDRICENISKELKKYSGNRVLIIFGLDHKFFIDDCVSKIPGQDLIAVNRWWSQEGSSQFTFSPEVKKSSLENLRAAQKLLQNRLGEGFYKGEMRTRLQKKFASFETWIKFVEDL